MYGIFIKREKLYIDAQGERWRVETEIWIVVKYKGWDFFSLGIWHFVKYLISSFINIDAATNKVEHL